MRDLVLERLVQDLTETGEILDPDKVYELGEGALRGIAESEKPDTVKVFNLVTSDVRCRVAP